MELVLIALLVAGVIAFIAYPLFAPSREERPAPAPGPLDTLVAQRDALYDALRDLDFDFQLGKLSTQDYHSLREQYKARAAVALQQIDAAGDHMAAPIGAAARSMSNGASARIEEQVARLRHSKPARDEAIESEVARLRKHAAPSSARCSQCGTPSKPGDRFCANCGSKLA